jgi:UDP-glucose 4-epimerase
MRVAIAGASGLIGHAIASALAAQGDTIVTIGRRRDADVRVDLADPRAPAADALRGCDTLVHAAGVTDEDFADPEAALRKANAGAEALVRAAQRAGVSRLAYISSAHVYGPLIGKIDEARAPEPRSDYARAHRQTEQLFEHATATSGASVLIARPCAVFGMPPALERFTRWSLIPFSFPREALSGAITLRSAGEQRRNFVSAPGVANLVGSWLGSTRAGVTIANAPGPEEMSVYDFARLCARIAGEETGRACEVRRPAAAAAAHAPFEYRTRVGGHLPGPTLEDHVRALMRALSKKEAP